MYFLQGYIVGLDIGTSGWTGWTAGGWTLGDGHWGRKVQPLQPPPPHTRVGAGVWGLEWGSCGAGVRGWSAGLVWGAGVGGVCGGAGVGVKIEIITIQDGTT